MYAMFLPLAEITPETSHYFTKSVHYCISQSKSAHLFSAGYKVFSKSRWKVMLCRCFLVKEVTNAAMPYMK